MRRREGEDSEGRGGERGRKEGGVRGRVAKRGRCVRVYPSISLQTGLPAQQPGEGDSGAGIGDRQEGGATRQPSASAGEPADCHSSTAELPRPAHGQTEGGARVGRASPTVSHVMFVWRSCDRVIPMETVSLLQVTVHCLYASQGIFRS